MDQFISFSHYTLPSTLLHVPTLYTPYNGNNKIEDRQKYSFSQTILIPLLPLLPFSWESGISTKEMTAYISNLT